MTKKILSHFTFLISTQSVRKMKLQSIKKKLQLRLLHKYCLLNEGRLTVTNKVPKKKSYVAQSLTGVIVSPNTETDRREYGSVEVAYDIERVGPLSGLLEIKQQYIAPPLCIKALSTNKDEIRLKNNILC